MVEYVFRTNSNFIVSSIETVDNFSGADYFYRDLHRAILLEIEYW